MWIDLLVAFLIFAVIVVVVFYALQWLMQKAGLPAEVQRIITIVVGLIAICVFLIRFVKPLLG